MDENPYSAPQTRHPKAGRRRSWPNWLDAVMLALLAAIAIYSVLFS
jgi:hypothetical protein